MEHRHTHSAHMIRLTHMTVESITDRNDCTNVRFGEPVGFLLGLRRGMLVKVLKEEGWHRSSHLLWWALLELPALRKVALWSKYSSHPGNYLFPFVLLGGLSELLFFQHVTLCYGPGLLSLPFFLSVWQSMPHSSSVLHYRASTVHSKWMVFKRNYWRKT